MTALRRWLCKLGLHVWRISDMDGPVDVLKCERCGREKEVADGKTLPPIATPVSIVRPAKTIRTCKHLWAWVDSNGGMVCCDCGRLLNDDGSER